ncbi:MAG: O-antigen ligase family protein [Azospirillaceae bacterium]|nr:O-antigen ligase family protein [Azospirillaceae bacterium]
MSSIQTKNRLRTSAPVISSTNQGGIPSPRRTVTAAREVFTWPWMGVTLFLLAVLGFICALVPLGTAPVLISLSILGGALYLLRTHRLPTFLAALKERARGPLLPMALFLILGAVSILWTPVRKDGAAQTLTFLYTVVPFIFCLGTLREVDDDRRRLLMRWLVGGMVVGLILFAIEVIGDQPIYRLEKAVEGTNVDHDRALNRPAVLFTTLAWPVGLALARLAWPLGRAAFSRITAGAAKAAGGLARGATAANRLPASVPWAWVLPAGFFLVSLGGTSASAKVGLGVGLACFALARLSARLTRVVLMVALLAGPTLSIPISLGLYHAGLTEETRMPFSFRHRIEIWDVAARRILEKPLLGWGLDSSRHIPDEGEVSKFHPESSIIPLHPHNLFLQILLELGVAGGLLYAWFGVGVVRAIRRLPDYAQPSALAMAAATIGVGCFSYGAWQTWWLCGIMLSVGILELCLPVGWWARAAGAAKAVPAGVSAGAPGRRRTVRRR